MIDIKGYEGLYAVTTDGKIYSFPKKSNNEGKFLKQKITKNGYCEVNFSKKGKVKSFYVHRLVAFAFINNPESKPQVNHKDSDKTNNNINYLEWVSCSENQIHFNDSKNSNMKYSNTQIPDMEKLYKIEKNYSKVGRIFGIKGNTVKRAIKLYNTRKGLKDGNT